MWNDAWAELEELPPERCHRPQVILLRVMIYNNLQRWEEASIIGKLAEMDVSLKPTTSREFRELADQGLHARGVSQNPVARRPEGRSITQNEAAMPFCKSPGCFRLPGSVSCFRDGGQILRMVANIGRFLALVMLFRVCVGSFPAQSFSIPAQPSTGGTTAQQRAVAAFPDLAEPRSRLNHEFLRRYKIYRVDRKDFFKNPEWPTELARESQLACQNGVDLESKMEFDKLPKWSAGPGAQHSDPIFSSDPSLPQRGEIQLSSSDAPLAPFEVKSSAGTNYFVKMYDVDRGKDVVTFFVRGGETVAVKVPLGTYKVKYAAGDKWYGRKDLFGPDTSYNQAGTTFYFHIEGKQISGYTITLYKVPNGNLPIHGITASEF
jgi:hypothetical protein